MTSPAAASHASLLQTLLEQRGISTPEEAVKFLSPDFLRDRHDPFLMTDMERVVERILRAIKDDERIAIWSDYDCDGIPGGVVLHDFFRMIGFTNFENYIPHRHEEGFGLNISGISALKERGAKLLITIDCAIGDIEQIAHARDLSIHVIVTDHHEPKETLPPAYAILDPKRDHAYPFRELCGSGVVWKLVEALRTRGSFDVGEGQEKWLLDMVGLATLADMVPLVGENRMLATYGLQVLRKTRRKGLHALFRAMRISREHLTEDDIGFSIAPRINASSRMDSPELAFRLLTTTDDGEATTLARELERVNAKRKGSVAAIVKEAKQKMLLYSDDPVIVIGDPEWRPALVGPVANTLSELYGKPVFIWGRDGRGVIKGSCRSGGRCSLIALMNEARDAFLEYGGHHGSGGFSVRPEAIHSLPSSLRAAYENVEKDERETVEHDVDATLREVNRSLYETLSRLQPYGMGNPKPLFRFESVLPTRVEQFGKAQEHLKAVYDADGRGLEAVAFFAEPALRTRLDAGKPHTLFAHLEDSFFMNRRSLRLRIVNVI